MDTLPQKASAGWVNLGSLVVVNFLWASQYPAYKIASDHIQSGALNFWTLVIAGSVLALIKLLTDRRRAAPQRTADGRTVLRFVVLGVLGSFPLPCCWHGALHIRQRRMQRSFR